MNVEINNTGGTVIISDGRPEPPKQWVKKWHAFGLTFAVSNGRLKRRPYRDILYKEDHVQRKMRVIKDRIYQRNNGYCPHCHQPMDIKGMELHHILPWGRFPEYRAKEGNLELLCHKCHREIHVNPFLNIQMMKKRRKSLASTSKNDMTTEQKKQIKL